jgi:hypothetical protein
VATLSVNKVAVTTNGSMILTLNSSGSFSQALRGHCAPPRRCARRIRSGNFPEAHYGPG